MTSRNTRLVRLIRRAHLPAKVNLIAWNSGSEILYSTPSADDVSRFQQRLIDHQIPAYIRRPRGRDV